jgi:hypothetical protein
MVSSSRRRTSWIMPAAIAMVVVCLDQPPPSMLMLARQQLDLRQRVIIPQYPRREPRLRNLRRVARVTRLAISAPVVVALPSNQSPLRALLPVDQHWSLQLLPLPRIPLHQKMKHRDRIRRSSRQTATAVPRIIDQPMRKPHASSTISCRSPHPRP